MGPIIFCHVSNYNGILVARKQFYHILFWKKKIDKWSEISQKSYNFYSKYLHLHSFKKLRGIFMNVFKQMQRNNNNKMNELNWPLQNVLLNWSIAMWQLRKKFAHYYFVFALFFVFVVVVVALKRIQIQCIVCIEKKPWCM